MNEIDCEYKEALRAIIRMHCGAPYLSGQDLCGIAMEVLGDAEVNAILSDPDLNHVDGRHPHEFGLCSSCKHNNDIK